jgi:hypothetical protein
MNREATSEVVTGDAFSLSAAVVVLKIIEGLAKLILFFRN